MKTSVLVWIVIIIVLIVGGWYWYSTTQNGSAMPGMPSTAMGTNGSPDQGNMGSAATGTASQAGPAQPTGDGSSPSENLALGTDSNAAVGTYLIGDNGMSVYTYDKDTAGVSNCTGSCAANWPPYTVPAGTILNLQAGVSGAIATIARTDGTMQVTYKGMPLYFYAGDTSGSDVTGDGVGGVWHVAKP